MYSFPLNEGEVILKSDHASMEKEHDALNGAFYLTNERIIFVGYVGGNLDNKYMYDTQLEHIEKLIPAKTFFIINNVIKVSTIRDESYNIIIAHRDKWLEEINAAAERVM